MRLHFGNTHNIVHDTPTIATNQHNIVRICWIGETACCTVKFKTNYSCVRTYTGNVTSCKTTRVQACKLYMTTQLAVVTNSTSPKKAIIEKTAVQNGL